MLNPFITIAHETWVGTAKPPFDHIDYFKHVGMHEIKGPHKACKVL